LSLTKIKKTGESKKDALDPTKDDFIEKTGSAFDWAYAHRRPIGLFIVLALVAAVAGIIIDHFSEKRRAEESQLVSEGLYASFGKVETPSEDEAAPEEKKDEDNDDDTLRFDSAEARAKEALTRWTKVVDEGEAKFKNLGNLEKAATLLDLGEFDKAAAAYKAFLGNAKDAPSWLTAQAMEGMGYALESLGKLDEAKQEFEKWMNESDGPTKVLATYHAARLSQKKGDADAAKKLFKEVLDTYKDGNAPSRYDVLFVQARTRLLTLDPTAEVPNMPAGDMGGLEGMDPRILQQLMQAQSGTGAS
jgi:tetratricopeptide (TPR) repeat protein